MLLHGIKPVIYASPFLPVLRLTFPSLIGSVHVRPKSIPWVLIMTPFSRLHLSVCVHLAEIWVVPADYLMEYRYGILHSWNSIIHAYVKVGMIDNVRKLFYEMSESNAISWSHMFNVYVHSGDYKEALSLFQGMQTLDGDKVRPNGFTMSVMMSACGQLGMGLDQMLLPYWVHRDKNQYKGLFSNLVKYSCMVDLYGWVGFREDAWNIVKEMGINHTLRQDKIYMMHEEIMRKLKMEGYVADTNEVLLDVEEERKDLAPSLHSEELALAFALL
ncbi:Pentatricopeptide repeat [Dillenia turbinata]|uniref:Pentatricopeptide repeat n=1 Tax=Dillenia turbinata TaxID=194707 RepID=A0AAN8ZKK1_9MAGN